MGNFFFINNDISPSLHKKRELKKLLCFICKNENIYYETISYIFCSDNFLLSLNKKYLNHDFFTDILTFPLINDSKLITADIYISIDRVKHNASHLNFDYLKELNRVMIHGLLHLGGYSDKTNIQKKIMREREDFYLKMLLVFHVKHKN